MELSKRGNHKNEMGFLYLNSLIWYVCFDFVIFYYTRFRLFRVHFYDNVFHVEKLWIVIAEAYFQLGAASSIPLFAWRRVISIEFYLSSFIFSLQSSSAWSIKKDNKF